MGIPPGIPRIVGTVQMTETVKGRSIATSVYHSYKPQLKDANNLPFGHGANRQAFRRISIREFPDQQDHCSF